MTLPIDALSVAAMYEWIMLGVGILLTIGTGFFVASEFALVNLDRSDLEVRESRGERRLGIVITALKKTSTHLSSAQLGITLTTLLTGYTLEPALSSWLGPAFVGIGLSGPVAGVTATILAITLATLLSMIVGELVPKNLALAVPRATAKVVIPFQVLFTTVFRPVVTVLINSANGILRRIGIEPKEELSGARTAEELISLVRRSAREGSLDSDTARPHAGLRRPHSSGCDDAAPESRQRRQDRQRRRRNRFGAQYRILALPRHR